MSTTTQPQPIFFGFVSRGVPRAAASGAACGLLAARAAGRHAAVPGGFGAVGAEGRGGAAHPRQGARPGLPRGLRQVPVVSERVRAGALSPCSLQDARL